MTQILQISPEHRAQTFNWPSQKSMEVILHRGKNQSKGLSPLMVSFLRKYEYILSMTTLKFICIGHFSHGLSTVDFFLDATVSRRCHSPTRRFSHIQWGHLKWKLQQRHLDTWQGLVNDVSLASTRKPPMWIYHRKSCIQFWPLLKK